MLRSHRFFDRAVLLLAALILSACASRGPNSLARINQGKLFAVATDSTPFYRYGPQQGNGPDQTLPRDTVMTLIRPSFGYSKVALVSGGEGYVASEDIKPASPTLLAALFPPLPPPGSTTSENFDLQGSEPPPPETLPEPDLPPITTEPPPPEP